MGSRIGLEKRGVGRTTHLGWQNGVRGRPKTLGPDNCSKEEKDRIIHTSKEARSIPGTTAGKLLRHAHRLNEAGKTRDPMVTAASSEPPLVDFTLPYLAYR